MTAAWNQLYPEHQQTKLPVTDLYVQFQPQTFQELTDLQNAIHSYDALNNDILSNDPFLFDYPLDYEVVTKGDYYHDSKVPAGEITYRYAVVKPDFQFPAGLTYTILDELVLAPYNSFLTAEAFRRTGNDYYNHLNEKVTFCDANCSNYPSCLANNVGCDGGEVYPLPVPCLPGAPHWPFCLGLTAPFSPVGPTTTGGGPTTTTNSCGCPIYDEELMPSGCVQVEDTQFGFEGVKSVEVYVKDMWFTGRSTWTSNDGCWGIPVGHWGGMEGHVVWRNSRATIKGVMGFNLVQFGLPVTQNLGIHIFGPFNDFQVRHNRFADNEDIQRMHWYASTAMNALFEYDFYAQQEGTGVATANLQILLANHDGSASAPMFDKMQEGPIGFNLSQITGQGLIVATSPVIEMLLPGSTGTLAVLTQYILANLPDVVYAYGDDQMRSSDVVKRIFYHEYAHSAHYSGLAYSGRDRFWLDNIIRTVDNGIQNTNPPYGLKNTPGYGRTAIIEAWGSHMGSFMADLHYGIDNEESRNEFIPENKQKDRFIYRTLERFNPNSSQPDSWIPDGVFWDLMDDQTHNGAPLNIVDPVTDNTQGVTNAQIFAAITNSTPEDILPVRDAIKAANPAMSTDIDNLFLEYGY